MILIIDFGSQTAHLIGRRLRDLGILVSYCYPEKALIAAKYKEVKGIILSGGPSSVYESNAPALNPKVFTLKKPILGICYGEQLMVHLLHGQVETAKKKEYGPVMLDLNSASPLFAGIKDNHFRVWMSHGDEVIALPSGFMITASTTNIKHAAIQNKKYNFFGIQFHPEVGHTQNGQLILRNFAEQVCHETVSLVKLEPEKIIAKVRQTTNNSQVICAVSGGVDSTVAAFLIGKAIGNKLIPVYVDSGLMREGTKEKVKYIFEELMNIKVNIVNAKTLFLSRLANVTDPEKKRKIIGKLYVQIFEKVAKKYQNVEFLGQGTIYSDVIESKGSKHASRIKSHHNVGGLPKRLKLKLIEPLRHFYKDEVRKLGQLSGLPETIVNEQPFPGPGFAVRVRGKLTPKRLMQVKLADKIVVEELKKHHLYDGLFQCFAVMTGAKSTAVKGDARVFAEVVAVRAYVSDDIMTSHWADLPYSVLQSISGRIVNEVPDISRVVYDITTKPPATMEWE